MNTSAAVATYSISTPTSSDPLTPLKNDIRAWWETECTDWDTLIEGAVDAHDDDQDIDLWNDMPEVDSKAVARCSPIFKKFLGIRLDVKLIRPGGYKTLDEMIDHLVPLMAEAAQKKQKFGQPQEAQ